MMRSNTIRFPSKYQIIVLDLLLRKVALETVTTDGDLLLDPKEPRGCQTVDL